MSPRSLFNIVIKVFGLIFLKEVLISIPTILANVFYFYSSESPITTLIAYLIGLTIYVILTILLIFKSNTVIDKLGLDKGFDEERFSFEQQNNFQISITSVVVMKIFLVVLGGYILVDQIPNFFERLYFFIQQRRLREVGSEIDISGMVVTAVKIVIGFLIIGERNAILDFMIDRKKSSVANKEEFENNENNSLEKEQQQNV